MVFLYFSWLDFRANLNCNYCFYNFSSIVASHIASLQFLTFFSTSFCLFYIFSFSMLQSRRFFLIHFSNSFLSIITLLFKSFTEFLSIAFFRRSIGCFVFQIYHVTSYSFIVPGEIFKLGFFIFPLLKIFIFIYIFACARPLLQHAGSLHCGMQDFWVRHEAASSPTRCGAQTSWVASMESWPLDTRGAPVFSLNRVIIVVS